MTEALFQKHVTHNLALFGRRVLRVSDGADGRRGCYGLRAITQPRIDSTGADLFVLPRDGIRCVVAHSWEEVRGALDDRALFVELKKPGAAKRYNEAEQKRWLAWVSGGRL